MKNVFSSNSAVAFTWPINWIQHLNIKNVIYLFSLNHSFVMVLDFFFPGHQPDHKEGAADDGPGHGRQPAGVWDHLRAQARLPGEQAEARQQRHHLLSRYRVTLSLHAVAHAPLTSRKRIFSCWFWVISKKKTCVELMADSQYCPNAWTLWRSFDHLSLAGAFIPLFFCSAGTFGNLLEPPLEGESELKNCEPIMTFAFISKAFKSLEQYKKRLQVEVP